MVVMETHTITTEIIMLLPVITETAVIMEMTATITEMTSIIIMIAVFLIITITQGTAEEKYM